VCDGRPMRPHAALLMLPGLSFAVNGLVGPGDERSHRHDSGGLLRQQQPRHAHQRHRRPGSDHAGKFGSTLAFNGATRTSTSETRRSCRSREHDRERLDQIRGVPVDDTAIVSKRTAETRDTNWTLPSTADRARSVQARQFDRRDDEALGATVLQLNQWYYVTGSMTGLPRPSVSI